MTNLLPEASSGLPQWLSNEESACNAGDVASIPGWRRACQRTPVILAWRILWTEEPGGL